MDKTQEIAGIWMPIMILSLEDDVKWLVPTRVADHFGNFTTMSISYVQINQ